jgi:hypothetical protein
VPPVRAPVSLPQSVRCGQEYEDAVRENVDVMSRYLNRVAELNRELEELRTTKQSTGVFICVRSLPPCAVTDPCELQATQPWRVSNRSRRARGPGCE